MGNCFTCFRSKRTTRPVAHFNDDEHLGDVPDKRVEGKYIILFKRMTNHFKIKTI